MTEADVQREALQPLVNALYGPIQWQLVELSLRLQLFDHLREAQVAAEVAAQYGWQTRPTELLLNGLCSLGLLDKCNGLYRLPAVLGDCLDSDSGCYIGGTLLHMARTRYQGLHQLEALLKGDTVQTDINLTGESFWQRNADNLLQFHRCIGTAEQLELLQQLPEWPRLTRVLDLGAGSESMAEAILAACPDKRVCLFDLPGCIEQIRRRLPHDSPIDLQSGDYNSFNLQGRYDLIWASMTLYYAEDLAGFLARIRAVLNDGGVFVSFHEALEQERSRPFEHVVGRLMPAMRGQDLSFSAGTIRAALLQAGFTVEQRQVSTLFGPMVMEIGRP